MKKLNSSGFAHLMALILVVVGIGIGGVYYLVASKADSFGNPLSSKAVCENAHFNRTWVGTKKKGTCTKTCQPGFTHIIANPYDYCTKVTSPTATRNTSPVASKSNCQNAPYFRVWSNGKCTKTCQASHPVHVVASPYDYCKAAGNSTSSTPKPTPASTATTGRITASWSVKTTASDHTSRTEKGSATSTNGAKKVFSFGFGNFSSGTIRFTVTGSVKWKLCSSAWKSGDSVAPTGQQCWNVANGTTRGVSGGTFWVVKR